MGLLQYCNRLIKNIEENTNKETLMQSLKDFVDINKD